MPDKNKHESGNASNSSELFDLSDLERTQIYDILIGDANVIASYYDKNRESMPHRVNQGMQREMRRLRRLASKVKLPEPEEDYEDEHYS